MGRSGGPSATTQVAVSPHTSRYCENSTAAPRTPPRDNVQVLWFTPRFRLRRGSRRPHHHYSYDAVNRLESVSQPANDTETITTGYDYDLAGNLTSVTDGEANTTTFSYNTWNLVEDVVEPSTTAYPNLSDRAWTTSYDAGGLPIAEDQPGGVSVTRTFDELGRMTAESGTGDGTASRSLSYDLAGLLVGVDHPSGTIGYTCDDRGLLTDVSGPGGTATYSYDDAGRMIQRVDAAGTASFTWTPRFELDTVTDPATGATLDYTWDAASELTGVDYGTSGAVRTYSYDGQGRQKTDTLVDDTSTTVVSDVYGYDSDSNLTSKTIVLPGNSAAGAHSYTYDYADRLASWTDPGSTTTDYTWDLAGNRVGAGSDTFTYDQRNRLTSGPDGDYTYTARGTLDTIDTTRVYDYDPLGRLTTAEGVTYSYDGLDRVATRGSDDFEYSGPGFDPVTDANQTFTRTPGGHLLSITDGTTDLLAGVDRHGDLTHLYQADGTITDTQSYDPYGVPADTTGSFNPTVGFQSDWTDPTTTHVWQGARWYQPAWAGFLSRDTLRGELATPVSLNRYTYANNNPLNNWDPYGQQPIDPTSNETLDAATHGPYGLPYGYAET